ncbi:unnamed protein product [Coffea canephora]|uniref:Uncharacterized protein n=1 Tax=Coffea canephora TaxID=49390 RepID=A0A068U541_COFCA|nr:unnamed protein product [Coffea canephora]
MEESAIGSWEMQEFTDIHTASDSLNSSVIFHVVTDILAFVLYMHHQIPSVLQDISLEFDELQKEYKDLEILLASQAEMKASLRRKHVSRKREVKQGIRRLEKLINSVSNFETALQLLIPQIPQVERLILVLGPSPLRPIHLYELCFSSGTTVSADFVRTKVADGICRKAIRTLISGGAGSNSDSYSGPSKLFLLVKAPSSLNLPLHFLPKREFRYNKKIAPFKLRFKCRSEQPALNAQVDDPQPASSVLMNSTSTDNVWFQCRHIIKGLASKSLSTEGG